MVLAGPSDPAWFRPTSFYFVSVAASAFPRIEKQVFIFVDALTLHWYCGEGQYVCRCKKGGGRSTIPRETWHQVESSKRVYVTAFLAWDGTRRGFEQQRVPGRCRFLGRSTALRASPSVHCRAVTANGCSSFFDCLSPFLPSTATQYEHFSYCGQCKMRHMIRSHCSICTCSLVYPQRLKSTAITCTGGRDGRLRGGPTSGCSCTTLVPPVGDPAYPSRGTAS